MASISTRGYLVPGIFLVVVAILLIGIGVAASLDLMYESIVIGVIMLVMGLCIVIKGISSWNASRVKAPAPEISPLTVDERHHFAPQKCEKCDGFVVNGRCSSCQSAFCSNCGTWSDRGAMRCAECNHMLPP
jgi:hypothetical protein